jgi:hypothetical protein
MLALVAGLCVLLCLPAPTAMAAGGRSPTCDAAQALVEAARPTKALAAISAEQGNTQVNPCPQAWAAATGRLAAAAEHLERARATAATAADAETWKAVEDGARAALEQDAQAAGAERLAERAKARRQALAPTLRSQANDGASAWDGFFADVVRPAAKVVAPVLAVLAGVVVLARLLLLVIPPGRGRARWRRVWPAVAGTAAVAGALVLVLVGPGSDVAVGGGLALAVTSAAVLGRGLGGTKRVSIEVHGDDGKLDETGTAKLTAALAELGASPARGIEVPRGTDVTDLSGAAIAGIQQGLVAAALRLLQALVGFAPWKVVVHQDSAAVTTVLVSRNGRTIDSAVLREHPLGPDGPAVDRLVMAAAFVLTTMARQYRDGFEGLAGASSWRSIAYHCVATTTPGLPDADRVKLLRAAVGDDEGNVPAIAALLYAVHRRTTSVDDLRWYRDWLRDTERRQGESPALHPLRARLLYTATALSLNLTQLVDTAQAPAERAHARRSALRLVALLQPHQSDDFARRMRGPAAGLFRMATGDEPGAYVADWLALPDRSVVTDYNEACRLAHDPAERSTCIRLLRGMLSTPERIADARRDPWLSDLALTPEFRAAFPVAPEQDPMAVQPFAPHAARLAAAGISDPCGLLHVDPEALARHLQLRRESVLSLQQAAELLAGVPSELTSIRVELLDRLWERGLSRLPMSPDDLTALTGEVCAAATRSGWEEPDATVLRDWLSRLAPPIVGWTMPAQPNVSIALSARVE